MGFQIDPESRRTLQELGPVLKERIERDLATTTYNEEFMRLSKMGYAEGMVRLSVDVNGEAVVARADEGPVTIPSDVPVAFQIAREYAARTGRAPRVRLGGEALSALTIEAD